MRGQSPTIGATFARVRPAEVGIALFQLRFLGCDRSLDVFEAEVQLIDATFLGFAAELGTAQLSEKMAQPFALRTLGKEHRLQRDDIIRQIVERRCHASRLADLLGAAPVENAPAMWITASLWDG
jgi:hypothetical protein